MVDIIVGAQGTVNINKVSGLVRLNGNGLTGNHSIGSANKGIARKGKRLKSGHIQLCIFAVYEDSTALIGIKRNGIAAEVKSPYPAVAEAEI